MKNKNGALKMIISFAFAVVLMIGLAVPTYAAESVANEPQNVYADEYPDCDPPYDFVSEVTITFDGNGGTPLDEIHSIAFATAMGDDMPDNPTRMSHIFLEWNTERDGTGYTFDYETTVYEDITVYAQWQPLIVIYPEPPVTYIVIYHGNNHTGGNEPVDVNVYVYGDAVTVLNEGDLQRTGYIFVGWNTEPDGSGTAFVAGDTFTITSDMTLYAQWKAIPPTEQAPPPEYRGRLLVTNMAQGTRERLSGSVFGIFDAMTDQQIIEVQTDRFGEATANLPVGDYFLRQTIAPNDYQLNMNRINFRIRANEITEVIVFNTPYPTETPPPAEEPGRLLVTAIADSSRDTLQGVVFGLYNSQTNTRVERLTTDRFGEAFVQLPAGDYFLRQISVPNGFILSTDRINVRIRAGALTEVTVRIRAEAPPTQEPEIPPTTPPTTPPTEPPTTPQTTQPTPNQPSSQGTTPPTQTATPPASTTRPDNHGTLRVLTRAEQSGNMLSGVTFGVYRVSDGARVAELATNLDGLATRQLPAGEYYLRNLTVPFGFLPEQSRVFFTVTENGTVTVDITLLRDGNIPYADNGNITLPQTGELLPILNYVAGAVFMLLALLCGIGLWKQRNGKQNTHKGGKEPCLV